MIGIRAAARIWALQRSELLPDDNPSHIALAAMSRGVAHHRSPTTEELDAMAQTYCEQVADNIRRRRDELGRDPSEFEGIITHLLEGPGDLGTDSLRDIARELQVSPAVLLTPHAWDPEADPSDGWLDEDDLEG